MKPNDIRPSKLMKEALKNQKKDIAWLIKSSSKFITVPCPACGSEESSFEFEKFTFKFFKCSTCNTVYMKDRANDALLRKFYQRSELYSYWDQYIFPATRKTRIERLFKPRATEILSIFKKRALNRGVRVLDVGAGSGMFLEACHMLKGYERVVGVEPNASQQTTSTMAGFEVYANLGEVKKEFANYFDVVVSFETIEHVSSPFDFLGDIAGTLMCGGSIYLTCPNYQGFDIQILGVESDSIDAEHVNLFNPHSIELLLQRLGFTHIDVKTPGKMDINIVIDNLQRASSCERSAVISNLLSLLKNRGALDKFQGFLSDNLMSSHMRAIGVKN